MTFDKDKREKELDEYEARFGQYIEERGALGMIWFKVGVQSFPIDWTDDSRFSDEQNAEARRWMKRMLCHALHVLVEGETARHAEKE